LLLWTCFFFDGHAALRALPSFPTRRSSDLGLGRGVGGRRRLFRRRRRPGRRHRLPQPPARGANRGRPLNMMVTTGEKKAGPRRTVVFNGRVMAPGGDIEDGVVVIDGGRISFVGPAAAWREGGGAAAAVRIDAEGGWICPGFVDIHVHGGGGADVMDADPDALRTLARTHARYGTTSFL